MIRCPIEFPPTCRAQAEGETEGIGEKLVDWANIKDVAGPIATVIAAGAAAFVAYRLGQSQISIAKTQADIAERNWQTSNERIVLELFERRLAIYEEIREAIGEVVRSGVAADAELEGFDKATDRVPYFFGVDVQAYLKTVRTNLIALDRANQKRAYLLLDEELSNRRAECFKAIVAFYKEAPPLFEPYMRAHQKVA
jgi:hypothetical protein